MPDGTKVKYTAAVVTVSDRGSVGEREDESGPALREILEDAGIDVPRVVIVADERAELKQLLRDLCEEGFNLVVTTGGTGVSPRDVTPEATMEVIDREVPGMAEAMRAESLKVTPHAMISRAVCGLKGRTLIINLPGSPKGARECLEAVMAAVPHALEVAAGDVSECAVERPGD
ncbi:MAG: MogA/MoaB family molybdenum cofactor biosynthesis protein [Actinobacteria bacterium]|nr:MogA/MoaB family molybdenum cofactor biosynthesis protein [Actinomycetota bacterium]MCG2818386.1 MogA/MoaB family molybdenum cofactor biosynthesis protein [Actinomycetes bacterium]MBU4219989.1 MogA/MoaB family molybdenum cofactor biosynthesis protein [Actinomycetota bacterium]MBU4358335.1 MogA/MoaB family molybdenum cofactor biosynthesis protein [Actinomycetota bacterium]MBU4392784.1 MogA/MoaB family molybdenum cofactor biosynthesis protein [Actinomycetota bacterium]